MAHSANGPPSPLTIAPPSRLVTGAGAEAFEQRLHDLLTSGHRSIIVDLTAVDYMDSAGVRALVRGYTTAHRTNATILFACAGPRVERLLHLTRLDRVLRLCGSIQDAEAAAAETGAA